MSGKITFAIQEFEAACDTAIAALGIENTQMILNQRFDRLAIIRALAPKDKYSNELGTQETMKVRGVSEQERLDEIKALNKQFFDQK